METKGHLISATVDLKTKERLLTFAVDKVSDDEINRLNEDETLDIKAVKHRERRSRDANAYHWKLCGMIAAELGATLEEIHKNLMLKYGTISETDGAADYRIVPKSYNPTVREYWILGGTVHLEDREGQKVDHNLFWVVKESHLYNSKEMSVLIDGTISEAKELGIETLPPDEIAKFWEAVND